MTLPKNCKITRYTFTIPRPPHHNDPKYIHVEWSPTSGAPGEVVEAWAIRDDGSCCWTRSRDGFELERQPSNRTEDFLVRARWSTDEEALAEAERYAVPFIEEQWATRDDRRRAARARIEERAMSKREAWSVFDAANTHLAGKGCRADSDGDCVWAQCPQNRDNEPPKTGRHCPLDRYEDA